MTNADLMHLYFLLDRSGSMQSIREDTIGGFDAFIAEQRTQPGDCRVTLAQFDDRYDVVYVDLPVAEVPGLQLQPRGTTALLDAIGRLVTDAGERLAALPEADRPGTVIVGIMTDGHENSSKEWSHAAVKSLIQQQTQTYGFGVPVHGRRPGRDRGRHRSRRPGRALDDLLAQRLPRGDGVDLGDGRTGPGGAGRRAQRRRRGLQRCRAGGLGPLAQPAARSAPRVRTTEPPSRKIREGGSGQSVSELSE